MKYNPREVEDSVIVGRPGDRFYGVKFQTPMTNRENIRLNYQRKAQWQPYFGESGWFCPRIIPDNIARAFVFEGKPYTGPVGGKDMFGVEWEYIPASMGSIVRPGNQILSDVTKWEEVLQFPNFDEWDWAGSAVENKEFLKNYDNYCNLVVFTGWFERLISFMDCGPALISLQSRKYVESVCALLERLSDMWIDFVDHAYAAYGHNIDGFLFHDDWGAQDAPFFNVRIVDKLIVPAMRRVTDHIHELGYTCSLHSCGKIDKLVPSIIAAGWDSWDGMGINDYHTLHPLYGDQLIMNCTAPEGANGTEEEQLKAAQEYVDEYCDPAKPCALSRYTPFGITFRKEVYRLTRLKYSAAADGE